MIAIGETNPDAVGPKHTWGQFGKRLWRISDCPPLSDRINWYGAFNFSEGQSLIGNEGNCDKDHTVKFLERLKSWLPADGLRTVVIWDGAPWHRAKPVQKKAKEIGIELIALPGYSPDLNPIESLWKGMREDVTLFCCHSSIRGLFDACKDFHRSRESESIGDDRSPLATIRNGS